MKKTIPTSIAQTLFYIEEDSYEKLNNYLNEIRKYFGTYEDKTEIIQDIESRIREQLVQFSEDDKTERIITEAHVDKLIETIGWPKEFGDFSAETSENTESKESEKSGNKTRRRLYRDKDNAVIGGVAAGIATYFDIDPLIVRVIFLITIFFGGMGAVVYIVLWFIVPTAETATEILEMQGDPVNLNEIKKIIEEKINEIKDKKKIENNSKKFFEELRSFLLQTGGRFFTVAGKIIGVILKITAIIGTTMMFVFMLLILMSSEPIGIMSVFSNYQSLPHFQVFSFILFLIGIIPFMLANRLGNVLLGRKSSYDYAFVSVAFAIWIAALILGPVLFFSVRNEYVSEIQYQVEKQKSFYR